MVTCHSNSIINDYEVQHRITEECEECNNLKIEIQSLLVFLNSLQLTEHIEKLAVKRITRYSVIA